MPSAVRILHLHSSFDLGGKEARAVQLMHEFGDRAHHTILSAVPGAMNARNAINPSITVEFPGDDAPALYGKPGPARYIRLARYMQQFDLVLSYNWGSMDGVMAHTLLGRFMKLPPLIHHEDGFNEDENDKLNWKRNAFRSLALKGAYALVVPSQLLAHIGRTIWKMPDARLHQVANGIAVDRYACDPVLGSFPGLPRAPGAVIVGTIAGLRAVKNLPRLVRAVAAAGPDTHLAIAGEGPEREAIVKSASDCGMTERLLMPGFLAAPARYVGHFDIFALSSDSEQFPISLVEAMAAGLPVVSTDVGDVRNMVAPENQRFIVPKGDVAAFAKALTVLAADTKLRQEIGSANQALAILDYDEKAMFSRYRKLYGGAMNRTDFARQD